MDVDIVSESIQIATEDQRGVHERARIHKLALLSNFHSLDVEYETTVEYLERKSTLASEDQDFMVSDLVSQ